MQRPRLALATLGLSLLSPTDTSSAQVAPPTVRSIRPGAAGAGETVKVTLSGSDLDGTTAILVDPGPSRRAVPTARVDKAGRETVEATITLPAGLPPGPIAIRVISPRGLSAAARFYATRPLPTVVEAEPNDGFRRPQAVVGPCTVDGNLKAATDVDVFAVEMKAGETLVAEVVAARMGATLDPVLTIFGPDGRELTSADDTFGRDAAVSARVTRAGRYFVQVVEANGRGAGAESKATPDRTYRLSVGTIPLVTSVNPTGARRGESGRWAILGVNLPPDLLIKVPDDAGIGDFPLTIGPSNAINLRVGAAPETREAEPDDRPEAAIEVAAPAAINGRFERKPGGDVDLFRIRPADGRARDYAITVLSARVGSPADPVLSVLDDDGRPVAEDDDALGRDARVVRRIEPKGLLVAVREFHERGGDRFLYRVEVEPVAPITLTVDLASRTVPRGGRVALAVGLERRGYDGPVTILAGVLPPGVSALPATIPAGATRGLLLLSAESTAVLGAFPLRLSARDVPGPVDWAFNDPAAPVPPSGVRSGQGGRGGPPSLPGVEEAEPVFAVAEPAGLGLSIEPAEVTIRPGGEAEIRVKIDRRGDGAKGPVKVSLVALAGDFAGFDAPKDETFAAGVVERSFGLKAKPDAGSRRLSIAARARFEASPEAQGVASGPVVVVVSGGPK